MDPRFVEMVERYADMIQIGARNMQNFALLTEVGRTSKPVLLKRGMSATVEDLLMSAEYILSQGNSAVVLCERGVKSFDKAMRNLYDVASVALVKGLSHLPIIVDPSHATGRPDLIPACALAGVTVDVAVCPPSLYLEAVGQAIKGSAVGLGAQNCHHEAKGAFTGEVSPQMLRDIGCSYVILGHSERRQIFKESNQDVNRKLLAALGVGLRPIVCVGETLCQRQAGETAAIVREQIEGSLADLSREQIAKIVIAYEPVWAIGT